MRYFPRRRTCGGLLLVPMFLVLCVRPLAAHDWYPHECCHGQDCAVVTSLIPLAGGGFRVETSQGFATVPKGFAARPSPDQKAHACLRQNGPTAEHRGWTLICLFLPGTA